MAGPVAALNWVELFVGLVALIAAGYGTTAAVLASVKKGYIFKYVIEPRRKAKRAHEKVETVEQKVDDLSDNIEEVADHQEIQTDALIAVGESMANGKDFAVDEFQKRADRQRAERFLEDTDD